MFGIPPTSSRESNESHRNAEENIVQEASLEQIDSHLLMHQVAEPMVKTNESAIALVVQAWRHHYTARQEGTDVAISNRSNNE